jgi:hypothetical protein
MPQSKPIYPAFNPQTDGNPFDWIVQTSRQIRHDDINGQRPKLHLRSLLDKEPRRVADRPQVSQGARP